MNAFKGMLGHRDNGERSEAKSERKERKHPFG